MALTIRGTNIASTIRPFTTEDKFPTFIANEGKGGCHQCNSIEEMYKIPYDRREIGMLCTIGSSIYILKNNPENKDTSQDDWLKLAISIDDLSMDDIPLKTYLSGVKDKSYTKYIQFVQYSDIGAEVIMPFACDLTKITSCVPVDTVLSADLSIQLQQYTNTKWNTLATVSVSNGTKEGTLEIKQPIEIPTGARIRMYISSYSNSMGAISSVLETIAK